MALSGLVSPASPAHAQQTREPDARLQVLIKSVKVHDDLDFIGDQLPHRVGQQPMLRCRREEIHRAPTLVLECHRQGDTALGRVAQRAGGSPGRTLCSSVVHLAGAACLAARVCALKSRFRGGSE